NNSFSIEDFRIYTRFVQIADLPGIYDFTAMGLLDDRQIDYYNSTQSVQRRIGCEIDNQGHFPKAFMSSFMMESTFSFDIKESQWVTSFDAALPIKRKWDNVPILNQYTKGYLEKECVDWLKIFREFANKELRNGFYLIKMILCRHNIYSNIQLPNDTINAITCRYISSLFLLVKSLNN
uniref:MHC class I-like antigen recognition-like domain-containing protein n=1 Tax=Sinocyclocheilus rhinocerous TaxID=307959 RepID=A0A673MP87_9TELE